MLSKLSPPQVLVLFLGFHIWCQWVHHWFSIWLFMQLAYNNIVMHISLPTALILDTGRYQNGIHKEAFDGWCDWKSIQWGSDKRAFPFPFLSSPLLFFSFSFLFWWFSDAAAELQSCICHLFFFILYCSFSCCASLIHKESDCLLAVPLCLWKQILNKRLELGETKRHGKYIELSFCGCPSTAGENWLPVYFYCTG